jgi:hypothetical protein
MGAATTFRADVFEGDVQIRLPRGQLKAAGGYLKYVDNDTADNHRDVYFYYVEGVAQLTRKFYAAARWSQILAPQGFPIVGYGDFEENFSGALTESLGRLSLGVGYRYNENVLFKTPLGTQYQILARKPAG